MEILFYVLDSLRPDFLGCCGHDFDTSPNIDSFANDAVRFETAYSTSNWTKPAAASLLTGRYPAAIHVDNRLSMLPAELETLPQQLRRQGYETIGVTANSFVSSKFGFDRGFEKLRNLETTLDADGCRTRSSDFADDPLVIPQSADLNDWLFDNAPQGADRFALVWSVDTHNPYFTRGAESRFGNDGEEYVVQSKLEQFVRESSLDKLHSLYRDMIRYNDEHLGNLLDWLKRDGRYEEALIVVLGDHGEAFGEHGRFGHNGLLHEEEVRVPLLVKFPQNERAGTTVEDPVSLVDLFETVRRAVDVQFETQTDGRPLQAVMDGSPPDRAIALEDHMSPPYATAYRWREYKYVDVDYPLVPSDRSLRTLVSRTLDLPEIIKWRKAKLYDLAADPEETSPLPARQMPDKMSEAIRTLSERVRGVAETVTAKPWDPHVDEREQLEEKLQSLGYMD